MGLLHSNMVDLPANMVLLGSNRNRIGSTGRAQIGASVSEMTLLPHKQNTSVQPTTSLKQLGSSEYSDFQQQGFGNYWGAESLDATG
jgi:hypothetical protein